MKPRNLFMLTALLALAIPFHAAGQPSDDPKAAVCVADPVLDQVTARIELTTVTPVCRGRCTYSTGAATYSKDCNQNCKCPETDNGNQLYQFSCDGGVEHATHSGGDGDAIGSLP